MDKASSKIPANEILGTGVVAGVIYFLLNLVLFFPSEQLSLMPSRFLRVNLFIYSFSIWFVGFTVLTGALYVVTAPLAGRAPTRNLLVLRRFIVYLGICMLLIVGYAIWTGYANTAPLLPSYIKLKDLRTSAFTGAAIAGLVALILSFISSLVVRGTSRRRKRKPKALGYLFAACLVYVVVVNLPVDFARLGSPGKAELPPQPRIVILGVDAGSWNVILPFLKRGDLPAFRKMMDEGTYGYFDTYGRQLTPPSWTTIATGKTEEKHGVHDFAYLSSDWKAAPIWSIMSSAGRRVAVVNWVCTWPPFEVNGGFVSKVLTQRKGNVYFSEDLSSYREPAEKILGALEYGVARDDKARVAQAELEMSQLIMLDNDIMSAIDPDFVAYFYYATDMVQHFFWKQMDPDIFREGDWIDEHPDPAFSDAIRETWIRADRFLSHLMKTYGDDTYYVVVSDHGARPVTRRKVDFDMNILLEELGYLTRRSGEVHYESSTCYVVESGSPHFLFNIKINPSEYTNMGEIDLERYRQLTADIVRDLTSVEFKGSGKPVFESITPAGEPGGEKDHDIQVLAAKAIMVMPRSNSMMIVGDREVPATRLLHYHPWSGRHRARGIVLAKGPALKHRYTGAWAMDDPYTMIFRYSHGIFKLMDQFSAPLRRLHLVDEATNLDIAPTMLYLSGLPVARDMDGRILTEIIEGDFADANPVKTVSTYRIGEILRLEGDPAEEEKIKERLKALGYIQ